jgi:hypothetical protein
MREQLAALYERIGRIHFEPPALDGATVPTADSPELVPAGAYLGPAEGQSFSIEYVDSRGQQSCRPITVYSVVVGQGGIPCLYAKCHLRKEMRSFRIDRIREVFDLDGMVHDDVPAFLHETLGIEPSVPSRASANELTENWSQMRSACRPFAHLLAGLSRADGVMVQEEIEVAADYCIRLCERRKFAPCLNTDHAFRRYIKNLRPDHEAIMSACDVLLNSGVEEIVLFLRAGKAVIHADGKLYPEETAMLNEISVHLTGLPID